MLALKSLACAVLLAMAGRLSAAETKALRPWTNYQAIMWVSDSAWGHPAQVAQFFARLREMGIGAAMVHGDGNLQPLVDNRFLYYVENMVDRGLCLKFHSKVTDWDKFVTGWSKTGRSEAAFVRDYSLDDPQWTAWAEREVESLVRKNKAHHPIAYNIRDELSTTISANPFDYDFSSHTLAAFREWLQRQYSSLGALNREWETAFDSWDQVRPFTTDGIKSRMASGEAALRGIPDWHALSRVRFDSVEAARTPTRWNFAPWCDFRTYMDLSLARTLGGLRDAAHAIDPDTPVGIEGTQMPSAWGGYDLWRLSQVLDWVEPYDIGNAREIFGSFMPGKPLLTTVFEKDTNEARRRLWHLLLEGDRGCLVWWSEDCVQWTGSGFLLTDKAMALSPALKEMTSPLAALFLRATREHDPVYLLYSQPSIQVDWLIESTRDVSSWHRRFSSFEAGHNVLARKRNGWLKLFQDLGFSPRFVAAGELDGPVNAASNAVLVLADAWALSDPEIEQVRRFSSAPAAASHTLFLDGPVGAFDEHGRLRLEPPVLSRGGGVSAVTTRDGKRAGDAMPADMEAFARGRKHASLDALYDWADRQIRLPRAVRIAPQLCTRVHRFRAGDALMLAFERNIDYHMSEDLKQEGGNEPLEKPAAVEASLDRAGYVYELRSGRFLGHTSRISFTLDPWRPSLFAVVPKPIDGPSIVEHLLAR